MQHPSEEVQTTINVHWHPGRLMGDSDDIHRHSEEFCRAGNLPHLFGHRRGWILPWCGLSDYKVSAV